MTSLDEGTNEEAKIMLTAGGTVASHCLGLH